MNKNILYFRIIMVVALLVTVLRSYSQDTTLKAPSTKVVLERSTYLRFEMPFDYLDHRPKEQDKQYVKKYIYLKDQQPASDNYKEYYSLACALWKLSRLKEAEKMFLTIINSRKDFYSTTYDHASDVSGDFKKALYGYGSYTSNYKNDAAVYLAKIYIEWKQFDKAYSFLEDAVKKYEVQYSCGTGARWQQDKYDFLYASIYEGQKKYDKVMQLLLPECLNRDDQIIVRTIRKLYSKEEIREKLQSAIDSMQCEFDSEPSHSYIGYGPSRVETYYSGKAKINLFGQVVEAPRPHLGDGGRATRALFIEEFKETGFYRSLLKPE